jgi:hypothetical protein
MATYSVLIGSLGVTLLLLAFLLNLFSLLSQNSLSYILMNVVGAGISCYASYLIDYLPFVILEGAWMGIALIGLLRRILLQGALPRRE